MNLLPGMRGILVLFPFISVLFFPWPLSVLLALGIGAYEPLVPLAAGIFADTLYYSPGSGWPIFSLAGLAATVLISIFRSRYEMR